MSENVCCKSQWTSVDKRAALCKSYLSLLLSFDFNVPSTSCIGSTPATWSSCYDVVFSTSHLPHLYVCVVLNVINMDFTEIYFKCQIICGMHCGVLFSTSSTWTLQNWFKGQIICVMYYGVLFSTSSIWTSQKCFKGQIIWVMYHDV